ncbi:methyltransferase domain-containing protein [Salmonella enterica]|nr:methyltransferase domain-containing protein [Salmonella enterica]
MNKTSFKDFEYNGWQSVASFYQKAWVSVTNMFGEEIINKLNLRDKFILDVATGTGNMIPLLHAKKPYCIKAIDISENMINIARKKYPIIDFYVADITNLPFNDNSFDLVISNFGVQHFYNIEQSFSEISRILKPDGIFSFTIWAPDNLNLAGYVLNKAINDCKISSQNLPDGPDYHIFNSDNLLKKLAFHCNFDKQQIKRTLVQKIWELNDIDDLFNSEKIGSVRSGALLKSLDKENSEKLKLTMRHIILENKWIKLPMAAYIINVRKRK